jgi:hypothetical protein
LGITSESGKTPSVSLTTSTTSPEFPFRQSSVDFVGPSFSGSGFVKFALSSAFAGGGLVADGFAGLICTCGLMRLRRPTEGALVTDETFLSASDTELGITTGTGCTVGTVSVTIGTGSVTTGMESVTTDISCISFDWEELWMEPAISSVVGWSSPVVVLDVWFGAFDRPGVA